MTKQTSHKKRCPWPLGDPPMIEYHDNAWGAPAHDDRKLFEFLALDAFQAGVSWSIVLHKRENFRKAFHNFNSKRIAKYDARDVKRLLGDAGIIRNRLKIQSTITNAQRFIEIQSNCSGCHCEERFLRRSREASQSTLKDCFAPLAMTRG